MIHTYIITVPEVVSVVLMIVVFGAAFGWFMCALCASAKIGELSSEVELLTISRDAHGRFVKREAK